MDGKYGWEQTILDRALDYAMGHGKPFVLSVKNSKGDLLGDPYSQYEQSTVYKAVYDIGGDEKLTIRVTDTFQRYLLGDETRSHGSSYGYWLEDRVVEIILGEELIINGRKILDGEDICIKDGVTTKEPKNRNTDWSIGLWSEDISVNYVVRKVEKLED